MASILSSLLRSGEPTYRMAMLPFGTYANDDGTESLGLAVPGMIAEPVNALARLIGTPDNPGTFGYGPDYPGNAEDSRPTTASITPIAGTSATASMATMSAAKIWRKPYAPTWQTRTI